MIVGCTSKSWLTPFEGKLQEETIVETIEAFRGWKLIHDAPRIHSLSMDECAWPVREKLTACCFTRSGSHFDNGCIREGKCEGGIYALKKMNYRHLGISDCHTVITGTVYLWGHILECEEGYRAEFAYPASIFDSDPMCAAVAELYGVPLVPNPYLPPPSMRISR